MKVCLFACVLCICESFSFCVCAHVRACAHPPHLSLTREPRQKLGINPGAFALSSADLCCAQYCEGTGLLYDGPLFLNAIWYEPQIYNLLLCNCYPLHCILVPVRCTAILRAIHRWGPTILHLAFPGSLYLDFPVYLFKERSRGTFGSCCRAPRLGRCSFG